MKSGDWAKFMEGKDPTNYDNVHESDLEEDDEPGRRSLLFISRHNSTNTAHYSFHANIHTGTRVARGSR